MMTLVERRAGESMMVGDDVEIVVLSVVGNQVRVGINAPANVSVHREEIWMRIQNEQSQSMVTSDAGR